MAAEYGSGQRSHRGHLVRSDYLDWAKLKSLVFRVPLCNFDVLVRWQVPEDLDLAAGPADFQYLNPIVFPEAKVMLQRIRSKAAPG